MKAPLRLGLVGFVLSASSPARAAPEAVSARCFRAEPTIQVTLVTLKEPGRFLVEATGTQTAFDGMVLPYEVDLATKQYHTTWHGRTAGFLVVTDDKGYRAGRLYTPKDWRDGFPLTADEERCRKVNPAALVARHLKQARDGVISRAQRFDRAAAQAPHDTELAQAATAFNRACGTQIPAAIQWSTIDDETLKDYSISSFCAAPLSAMESLCASPSLRAAIPALVKKFACRFGATMTLERDAQGVLTFTTHGKAANLEDFAKAYWKGLPVPPGLAGLGAPIPVASPEPPPWGQLKTLGEHAILDATTVCGDGKSAYVILAPEPQRGRQLYYGNGKKFARVPQPRGRIAGSYFFDPRVSNPEANPDFRGMDMRTFSAVEWDPDKQTCTARCGTRRTTLSVLDRQATTDLIRGASFGPPLHAYQPHVLTRDDKGVYYYVDRGNTPQTEKKFRLFVGQRGSLKLKPLTNIVADSEGEIFSTKNGSLRFIAGPGGAKSSWVRGKKVTALTAIPVESNYSLIYNDLGVYLGERLGTPCDDW